MSTEALIGLLAAFATLLNGAMAALWAAFVRSAKNEVRAMRADIGAQLALITQRMDLHVIDRIDRLEREQQHQRLVYHEETAPAMVATQRSVAVLEERVESLEQATARRN